MARLSELQMGLGGAIAKIKKGKKRLQEGGGTAEDLPTTTGGAGTSNVQQTGEVTGFPSTAVTETTEKAVTDKPVARPISGVLPSQKVGLTEGETISPVTTTVNTEELVNFGQGDMTQLPSTPTVTAQGAIAPDVPSPTITAANTYSAYTQQNTPQAAAAQGSISPSSLVGDPTEFAKTAAVEGTVSSESIANKVTGELSNLGTVKGQIESLYAAMDSGESLPAWAAPAVRKVNAIMQQRGLGASSMAAAAITQALYESALPIAAQDAKTYASLDLQNLSNEQQSTLQNAMTYAAMDKANMSARLQAAVDNAKSFLTVDLKNLDNTQRVNEINQQTNVQKMLSDVAQENASRQFNAKTQNEVDEFFAELGTQISNANANRQASIQQVNTDQANAMQRFTAQMQDSRDKFNANMAQAIAQSNAQWRREVNTRDTAAINEANRVNAQALLGLTAQAQANLWQRYRDEATWVMSSTESALQRAHQSAMIAQEAKANSDFYDKQFKDSMAVSAGTAVYNLLSDYRLKENIIWIGVSPSGLNVYEWNYIWDSNHRYRGVMAQELLFTKPMAVLRNKLTGYLSVLYNLIDVKMERVL
tara:strand:- start:2445 stop:4217 length:1773 start_codon:yes stop_codon:yes gene_type:complete